MSIKDLLRAWEQAVDDATVKQPRAAKRSRCCACALDCGQAPGHGTPRGQDAFAQRSRVLIRTLAAMNRLVTCSALGWGALEGCSVHCSMCRC